MKGFAFCVSSMVRAAAVAMAILVVAAAVSQAPPAYAQGGDASETPDRVTNKPPPQTPVTLAGGGTTGTASGRESDRPQVYLTYKTPFEFHLTLLTAGLAVFMAVVLSVMARNTGITEDFIRSFMVVIIVFAALFLVVAGYSDEQTAPVFGLLGTIAGYIFGRSQRAAETKPASSSGEEG